MTKPVKVSQRAREAWLRTDYETPYHVEAADAQQVAAIIKHAFKSGYTMAEAEITAEHVALIEGLKRDAWPVVSHGEQPEAVISNAALDEAISALTNKESERG